MAETVTNETMIPLKYII